MPTAPTADRDRSPRGAAFFRLEGALHPQPAWAGALYLASNAASVRKRLLGMGGAALSAALRTSALAGASATRLSFSVLEGFSLDRVEVLAEDYARDVLVPEARAEAVRLLEGARRDGLVTVLVSESIAPIAEAFSRSLLEGGRPAFDVVLANRLELDARGQATGKLAEPLIGPEIDPRRLRALAEERGLELSASRAYGHARADLVLLATVGHPCAIEPERELARAARDLDWPIVRAERPHLAAGDPAEPATPSLETDGARRT
jgi:phosphoserine phosphatase